MPVQKNSFQLGTGMQTPVRDGAYKKSIPSPETEQEFINEK
jgi:hypothetical protein